MKEYESRTFKKRVAYNQRQAKLLLVSRGIIDGFKVTCKSAKEATNLGYAFRSRSRRIEKDEKTKYNLRIKINGKIIYVTRKRPLQR